MPLRSSGVLSFVRTAGKVDVARALHSLTAIKLQSIKTTLSDNRCWAYSIAFDAATHPGESFIDVRVRRCTGEKLQNVHILAISIPESYTGENMLDAICRLQCTFIRNRRSKKLVGISIYGALPMVGRVRSSATRLRQVLPPGVYRVYCGATSLTWQLRALLIDIEKVSEIHCTV